MASPHMLPTLGVRSSSALTGRRTSSPKSAALGGDKANSPGPVHWRGRADLPAARNARLRRRAAVVLSRRPRVAALASSNGSTSTSTDNSSGEDSQANWATSAIPEYLYSPVSQCGKFNNWLRDAAFTAKNGTPLSDEELRDLLKRNPVWLAIRSEAERDAKDEPILSSFLWASILAHDSFERSLAFVLANRLADATMIPTELFDVFYTILKDSPDTIAMSLDDCQACMERDPACRGYSNALLYYKGFHAIQAQRIAHRLWSNGRKVLALALQSRVSEVLAVDIHPATKLGRGLLLDHGTGIVIGETAVVGDDCSILQGVTLGGTGKESGDRHPKLGNGVLIGANATVLGNIPVGDGAQIAASSLVLKPVPERGIVAGSPAKIIGTVPEHVFPACVMEHWVKDLDQDPYSTSPTAVLKSAVPFKPNTKGQAKDSAASSNGSNFQAPVPNTDAEQSIPAPEPKDEPPEEIDAKIAGMKLLAMSEAALNNEDHSCELENGELPSLTIREGSGSPISGSLDSQDAPSAKPDKLPASQRKASAEALQTAPWVSASMDEGEDDGPDGKGRRVASAKAAERLLRTLQPKKPRPSSISRNRDVTKSMTEYSKGSLKNTTTGGSLHMERPSPSSSPSSSTDLDDIDGPIEYNL